ISGNEKVVRPRLADAEFFFNTDRKKRLEDNLPRLETVLFQQQLGTLRDLIRRVFIMMLNVFGNHAIRMPNQHVPAGGHGLHRVDNR
ncbi:glycine--tRNA ligase subunit beta, partial [Klebsiella pneumoniae]|uniref:glycine--tRNA ligase subunit beta n=1 Tax=Klebsiella pneumoniae TaxID=573 RepID=UPI002E7AA097